MANIIGSPSLFIAALIGVPASAVAQVASAPPSMIGVASGTVSSEVATSGYLSRIEAIDRSGPAINAVLALAPTAVAQARALDAERAGGKVRGPLHGVAILIKDNIETADMPTTAGSLALAANETRRDAPIVARLRAAGAVIIGKTNLSEWANIRSEQSTSGWSAVGGLTRNPHAFDRNACGSSSGSGAGVAAGLAAAAIGTETDGSIVCPASANGIVGFKPTLGLVSRTYIVPISHSQDTAGPMALNVRDAAAILTVIAGTDPADPATTEADARRADYVAGLTPDALKGLRIGFVDAPGTDKAVFGAALGRLALAGASLVPVTFDPATRRAMGDAEYQVLLTELKVDLAAYLTALPRSSKVVVRSLADVIAFNKANAATELAHFGQDIFELAQATKGLSDPGYIKARATSLRIAGADGIDRVMAENKLDLIVAQTGGAAWVTTLGKGDNFAPPSASAWPAIAGYPHLTVPMGVSAGMPVGLSFIGSKWADALVLRAGHAFEMAGIPLRIKPQLPE